MSRSSRARVASGLGLAAVLGGCLAGPDRPRYVEPASALLGAGAGAPAAGASGAGASATGSPATGAVRLRAVEGAAALERRVLWRLSDVELGYAGEEQWTEAPAAYVGAALARELFEVRGLVRRADPDAPVLDVVVRRFEEDRREGGHQVRVALTVTLTAADGRGLLERTVDRSRPVEGDEVEAMAQAMGRALDDAVRAAAEAVAGALRAPGP